MKIQEVSQRTGLTKKTIRFYEAQALIEPRKTWRNGREYREYSETDVDRLLDIAALRRARFTIQEIKHMESEPAAIREIFIRYREGLYLQRQELEALIQAADRVDPATLDSEEQLIDLLKPAAEALPLPAMDIRPRFRYLDEQEDIYAEFRRRETVLGQKRREAGLRLGVHTALNAGAMYKKGNTRSLDLGNEQKLAIMQMLREDKEQ